MNQLDTLDTPTLTASAVFRITDGGLDLDGDRVFAKGIDFKTLWFARGATVMYSHGEQHKVPIGRCKNPHTGQLDVWPDGNGWKAEVWFYDDEFSQDIAAKADSLGASIAFVPADDNSYEPNGKGMDFHKVLITELSLTPVQSNPRAVRVTKYFKALGRVSGEAPIEMLIAARNYLRSSCLLNRKALAIMKAANQADMEPLTNDTLDGYDKEPPVETEKCSHCKGTGKCATCSGTKAVTVVNTGVQEKCGQCKGTGRCKECRGSGYVKAQEDPALEYEDDPSTAIDASTEEILERYDDDGEELTDEELREPYQRTALGGKR